MRKKGPSHKPKKKRGVHHQRQRTLSLEYLWIRSGGRCKYCKRMTILGGYGLNKATRDHVVPKSKGGKQAGNLVLACQRCNQVKGSMPAAEFKQSLRNSYEAHRQETHAADEGREASGNAAPVEAV